MTRWRRLVRDYEQRIDVSDAMILVAMGSLLLRRISHPMTFSKRTLPRVYLVSVICAFSKEIRMIS